MGGGGPKKKHETNAEHNAKILAGKKANIDTAELQQSAMRLRNARKKRPLFGGPETGSTLGGVATPLGVAV